MFFHKNLSQQYKLLVGVVVVKSDNGHCNDFLKDQNYIYVGSIKRLAMIILIQFTL